MQASSCKVKTWSRNAAISIEQALFSFYADFFGIDYLLLLKTSKKKKKANPTKILSWGKDSLCYKA